MGYWPLTPLFDAVGNLVPGFEYAHKIEFVHRFFESHHGSGVQDAAGKAARYSLIQQIGFKSFNLQLSRMLFMEHNESSEPRAKDARWSFFGKWLIRLVRPF